MKKNIIALTLAALFVGNASGVGNTSNSFSNKTTPLEIAYQREKALHANSIHIKKGERDLFYCQFCIEQNKAEMKKRIAEQGATLARWDKVFQPSSDRSIWNGLLHGGPQHPGFPGGEVATLITELLFCSQR